MAETRKARDTTAARTLAIIGGLITGTAGIFMAVYSVMQGAETGAGALLAASAVAFGFLASNLGRRLEDAGPDGDDAAHSGHDGEGEPDQKAGVKPVAVATVDQNGSTPDTSRENGKQVVRRRKIEAEPITNREREVLSLVAEGYSNKLISKELGISDRTVKNHLTITMTKLRASDRTHAVVTAFRLGWLDL